MRNSFLDFGDRLDYLMKKHSIKNATALAEALYTSGIMKYSSKQTQKECHSYTARTINIHLHYESAERISGEWILRYCTFFHCSADYLCGFISQPTYSQSDIFDQTGIYPGAAELLAEWKGQIDDVRNSPGAYLSYIITHPEAPRFFQALYELAATAHMQALIDDLPRELTHEEIDEIDDIDGISQWRLSKVFSRICDSFFNLALDNGKKVHQTHKSSHWADSLQ